MVKCCAAVGCFERHAINSLQQRISFHSFPMKDTMMLKKWCAAIRRKDFKPSIHSKLCSQHFENNCYFYRFGIKRLRRDAVPTIFDYNKPDKSTPKKECMLRKDSILSSQPEQTTDSPLVVKLFPRSSINSENEVSRASTNAKSSLPQEHSEDSGSLSTCLASTRTSTNSKSLLSHDHSDDFRSVTTCLPSVLNKTNDKPKNLTIYINKMYCCTPKSDLPNNEHGCNSASSTYSNSSVKQKLNSVEYSGTVDKMDSAQSTVAKLTDTTLNRKSNHQMISYKPFKISTQFLAGNLDSKPFDQSENDLAGGTVKVSMHVNKYVFSKSCNQNSSDNSYGNIASSDSESSKLETCSIEDFTISDMEDPDKAKAFFQAAKAKIFQLEEGISQYQKTL